MDTYKKKYEEANDKVAARFGINVAKEIFTDLYESEDEKIRKEILQSIRDNMVVIHKDDCIAWLEKQAEQKPADNKGMNIDEEFINALGTMLNDGLPDRYLVSEERIKKSAELLFSIARKQLKNEMQEWSEEDEKMMNSFLHKVEVCNLLTNKENVWIINKLKSLKQRIGGKL